MKGFKALMVFCVVVWMVPGCALPLGEDYLITRDGGNITYITDYDLLNYVPIPKTGERPVILVDNRGDLEAEVVWKDEAGAKIPLPFEVFAAGTVYQAEIRISAKSGYGFYPSTPFVYPEGKINSQTYDLANSVRTVTVTYNNSDEADLTFITDYNLQNYVPAPLAGDKPVRVVDSRGDLGITVEWEEETAAVFADISTAETFRFVQNTVYRAKITLAIKPGYRFSAAKLFAYPDGTVVTPQGSGTEPDVRVYEVTYPATRTAIKINDWNLAPYVPKPQTGTTALSSFAGSQYTGTVIWKNTGTQELFTGPFEPSTAYTAELNLNPVSGYTVTGLGPDVFTHAGAETISNPADSGSVTITFSPTGSFGSPTMVYDTILTGRLPKPVSGMTPVMSVSGAQYSGSVTWLPFHGAFLDGTAYKAVLTLTPAAGYTFNGIGQNVFSHGEAAIVTNPAGSGTVTITFPATASSTYQVITSFGPVTTGTSALWLMNEMKDDTYPLTIDLPDSGSDDEEVVPVTLQVGQNSPAAVIINGHNRTLKISSPGTLLTVGSGVSLTLQNITLEGNAANTAPLVKVGAGGRLTLGGGVTLTGNQSSGNVGGVWVNGGTLILNNGGTIEKMSAASNSSGGGVRIDESGRFIMSGGTIGGETSAKGNTVSAPNSGGGVGVFFGFFDMYGGTIKGNTAQGLNSGGGIYSEGAALNMYGGIIGGDGPEDANKADDGANGVYYKGSGMGVDYNMSGGIIKGNYARGGAGCGVYIYGSFKMSGSAQVDINDKVFLKDSSTIIILDDLTSTVAANIIHSAPVNSGTPLLSAADESLIINNYKQFLYDGDDAEDHIDGDNPYDDGDGSWVAGYK